MQSGFFVFQLKNLLAAKIRAFNASPRSFPHFHVETNKEKRTKKEKLYMMIMIMY
jgi:hypothetical protein